MARGQMNDPKVDLSGITGGQAVPAPDSVVNLLERDVVGNKADTANATVGATSSIMRYIKGLLGLHAVPGLDAVTNTNVRDVVGNKTDTPVGVGTAVNSIVAYIKGLLSFHVVPIADTANNVVMRDAIGNKTDAAVTTVSAVASIMAYVKGLMGGVWTNLRVGKLAAGRFSQVPFFEGWAGLDDGEALPVAATVAAADFQRWCGRFNNASLWGYQESGGSGHALSLADAQPPNLQLTTGAVSGNSVACGAFWPVTFGGTQQAGFAPEEERWIFDFWVMPDANNLATNDWFVGMINRSVDPTGSNWNVAWETVAIPNARFGFAIDAAAGVVGMACDGAAGNVTAAAAITLNAWNHLRAIYDIGTDIKFYLNGALIGTIVANLPTGDIQLIPICYIQTNANAAAQMRIRALSICPQPGV